MFNLTGTYEGFILRNPKPKTLSGPQVQPSWRAVAGALLLPILSAVRDTGAFFFVTSLCVASATHAYVIMNPRGDARSSLYLIGYGGIFGSRG